jgi:DnaJ-class molecular chaperone
MPYIECRACKGSGIGPDGEECRACDGTGLIWTKLLTWFYNILIRGDSS